VIYRPDIQGLRAIAILLVVFYHASDQLVPGGYIGVDVFFVISGFLITGIIVGDLRRKCFSFQSFYLRRVRRIFPALAFMLAIVSAAAYFLLPPSALLEYGQTLVATVLFVSNMVLDRLSGYFDGPAALKPLLHTWSLAIEEQFYLFFPLLLVSLCRWKQKYLVPVTASLAIVSLAIGEWTCRHHPSASFYLAPCRGFELLIGSLLSITALPPIANRALRESLSVLGTLAILLCAFTYNAATPFPGLHALFPCLASALIIYAGSSSLLSLRPLTFIGGISYALYLWHWPALAFTQWYSIFRVTSQMKICALAFAFLAATASTYLIERPILRNPSPAYARFALVAVALVFIGVMPILTAGLPGRYRQDVLRVFEAGNDFSRRRATCHGGEGKVLLYRDNCVFGNLDAPPSAAVWGDSYGAELVVALGELAAREGKSVMQITSSACPPSLDFNPSSRPLCAQHNDEVLRYLNMDSRIKSVVMIANYSGVSDEQRFMPGYRSAALDLIRAGKRVTVVYPIPQFEFNVPFALGLGLSRNQTLASFSLPNADYQNQNRRTFEQLDSLNGIQRVYPSQVFCDALACQPALNGRPLYFDGGHISVYGARKLVDAHLFDASL
jgi:peptidoglycan/LPS O-acetylase OafA/YrhL